MLLNKLACIVIVPCYNAANTVARAIFSVKRMYPSWVIVAIDDFSTDNTRDQLQNMRNKGVIEEVISHRQRLGISAARNAGIDWAKNRDSQYLLFLDADDHLLEVPDTGELGILGDLILFESVEARDSYLDVDEYKNHMIKINKLSKKGVKDILLKYAYTPNRMPEFTTSWAKLFKTDLIYRYKLQFNENMHTFEDLDFNFRFLQFADEVGFVNKQIYVHTIPEIRRNSATYGGDYPLGNMFSFLWAVRSLKRLINSRFDGIYVNYKHLIACYFSISSIRLASRIDSFESFLHCFYFFKKRINKPMIQDCFSQYDYRGAGGRFLLVKLIQFRMILFFTMYICWVNLAYKQR